MFPWSRFGGSHFTDGFETPFAPLSQRTGRASISGEIPPRWEDNSGWADVAVSYGHENDRPHEGVAALSMTVTRVLYGAAQLRAKSLLLLKKDQPYGAVLWLRSPSSSFVTIQIRGMGYPYKPYAERRLKLSDEWKRIELIANPRETTRAWLLIRMDEPGTIVVDDVAFGRLAPGTDASRATTTESESRINLLQNPRPIGGSVNGWLTEGDVGTNLEDTPIGPGCLRVGGSDAFELDSPPIVVPFGRTYSATAWLNSQESDEELELAILGHRDESRGIRHTYRTTTGWQQVALTGVLPPVDQSAYFVRLSARLRGSLCIAGLQIAEGEGAPAWRPRYPLDVSLVPEAPWGLLVDSEEVRIRAVVAGTIPPGAVLKLKATHVSGQTDALSETLLSDQQSRDSVLLLNSQLLQLRGMFRIEATVTAGNGTVLSAPAETLIARVPAPRLEKLNQSLFGIHVRLKEPDLSVAWKLGFKAVRIHGEAMQTKWAQVEPLPGRFRWDDASIDLAAEKGFAILGMLDTAPAWAARNTPKAKGFFSVYNLPSSLEQWDVYARAVVSHYKEKISSWEVWNEPWSQNFFPGGTSSDYLDLLRRAYAAVRAARPNTPVLAIDADGSDWEELLLRNGAAQHYDGLAFHYYASGADIRGRFLAYISRLLDLSSRYGGGKPVIATEGGLGPNRAGTFFHRIPDLREGEWSTDANDVVAYYLIAAVSGVPQFYLYSIQRARRLGFPNSWDLLEPGPLLKPLFPALATLAYFIDGLTWKETLLLPSGYSGYVFMNPNRRVTVLVASENGGRLYAKDFPGSVYDRWGNRMSARDFSFGASPVYVVSPTSAVE